MPSYSLLYNPCPPYVSRIRPAQRGQPKPAIASDTATPEWLPFPIPRPLYAKWRKYGEWDYKQQGFKYRDATQFNFGATASAAGLDEKSILALVQASRPTSHDVDRIVNPELQAAFSRDAAALDTLRTMAEADPHVIRIATDFTQLDSATKSPREQIGLTKERWNEYRVLFKGLSLAEGIVRTEDFAGAIFFVVRARGLCTGGSSTGYVYSIKGLAPTPKSPKDALNSEARQNPGRHYAYAFVPLTGNWYLFYEVDW